MLFILKPRHFEVTHFIKFLSHLSWAISLVFRLLFLTQRARSQQWDLFYGEVTSATVAHWINKSALFKCFNMWEVQQILNDELSVSLLIVWTHNFSVQTQMSFRLWSFYMKLRLSPISNESRIECIASTELAKQKSLFTNQKSSLFLEPLHIFWGYLQLHLHSRVKKGLIGYGRLKPLCYYTALRSSEVLILLCYDSVFPSSLFCISNFCLKYL